jgi:hypothetical protein
VWQRSPAKFLEVLAASKNELRLAQAFRSQKPESIESIVVLKTCTKSSKKES